MRDASLLRQSVPNTITALLPWACLGFGVWLLHRSHPVWRVRASVPPRRQGATFPLQLRHTSAFNRAMALTCACVSHRDIHRPSTLCVESAPREDASVWPPADCLLAPCIQPLYQAYLCFDFYLQTHLI